MTRGWRGVLSGGKTPRGSVDPGSERRAGVELEDDPRDLDVVAGLESLLPERGDHAHAPEPVLDVGERLLVLEVVAGDQALHGVAGDAELPPAQLLHVEAAARARAEDLELGHLARVGGIPSVGRGLVDGDAAEQLPRQRVEA